MSPSPISCRLSGASPAPGRRMPAVPAPHLRVHRCKHPRGDHWPRERGAGREHPALTPSGDSSGAWAAWLPRGSSAEVSCKAEALLITLSDRRSLLPCFILPSPLHRCTKHRPAPKPLGQALFPGWWGGGSYTAWLLLTSAPTPCPPHPAEVRARHPTRAAGGNRVPSPEGARGPHLRVRGCHHGSRCPQSHPAHHDPEGQALGGGCWRVHQQTEGE